MIKKTRLTFKKMFELFKYKKNSKRYRKKPKL